MNRSENMRAIRGKDTKPELAVRSLVHNLGYRFRLHRKELPGKPDLTFVSRRKVIFIHGCFWHSHNCKKGLIPHSNQGFWLQKLQRNKERDTRNMEALIQLGWKVLVVSQCELKDSFTLCGQLKRFLGQRGQVARS